MDHYNQFNDIQILEDKYVICLRRMLGQGQFASVFGGYILSNQNQQIAIKIIKTKQDEKNKQSYHQKMKNIKREGENQQKLQSENIVKMIAFIQYQENFYFILEFCEGKSLKDKLDINNLSQKEILMIFKQILNGYKELIKNQIIHRDLKPENILFSKGIAKIADFGFSKILDDLYEVGVHTNLGTPFYSAPEISSGKYSAQADIWSLGIILYEMIYGKIPFNISKQCDLQQEKESPIIYPDQKKVSSDVIMLMKRMLVVDPEKRISWNELFKDYLSQMIVYPQSETILINYTFEKDKKVQNIFNYFIYISDILQFIRYLMRDVYSLNSIVQFSKSQYFHYTLITVKYMLNEINFYLRILKGQNLMSILMLPSDFNLFKQSNKFEKVLRNFQSNEKNLQSFYTQIKRRYDEYLQSSKKREKQQLELYEQGFLQNENDQKFFEVFNQIYLKIIHHIRSKFNQIQVKVEVKDNLFRTLIKLLNCLQPLGFTHKKLESFQLIQKLHSSLNLEKEFVQLYAKILRSEK